MTDAASRQEGIGPICRKLSNAALARLIPADIEVARDFAGMIDLTEFHIEAQPTLFMVLDALQNETTDDHRTTVKRCEWLASWIPAHSLARTRLTQVIAALGYTALAALWEGHAATGAATAEFREGRLYLKGPRNKGASNAFKKAIGWGQSSFSGYTKEWSCAANKADVFAAVVAKHYLGITGLGTAVEAAKAYVAAQSKPVEIAPAPVVQMDPVVVEALAIEAAPVVAPVVEAPKVIFTKADDYIEIRSPYSGLFIAAIKSLPYHDRGWNKVAKCWTVKVEHMGVAVKAAVDAYGVEPVWA